MDQRATTTSTERKPFGRRTVLKGAAWSVPAVVAVGATPAFAATGTVPLLEHVSLSAIRPTAQPQKVVNFTWQLKANADVTVTSISFGATGFTAAPIGPFTFTAGETKTITFSGANGAGSSNVVPIITITAVATGFADSTFTTTATDVPPQATPSTAINVTASTTNPTV